MVHDISREGFFVGAPILVSEGSEIQAEFCTPAGVKFTVKGVVRWNTAQVPSKQRTCGFGVKVTWCGGAYEGFIEGAFAAGRITPG